MEKKEKIIIALKNTSQLKRNEVYKKIEGYKNNDVVIVYGIVNEISKKLEYLTFNQVLQMGINSKKNLHDIAVKNTLNLYPPVIYNIKEYLLEVFQGAKSLCRRGLTNYFLSDKEIKFEKGEMYTLTNEHAFQGAALIAIPEIRDRLRELYKEDLCIIPSSIHELIMIPVGTMTEENINQMIKDVNSSIVDKDEILNNKSFYFKSNI